MARAKQNERTSIFRNDRLACLAGLVLICVVGAPDRVSADCAQLGTAVTCSGADTDGFDAGVDNGLALEVEAGARVENPAGNVIVLNDASSVTVRDTGEVNGTADAAVSILAGDFATISIDEGAVVTASGTNATGIRIGNEGFLMNDGAMTLSGSAVVGIEGGDASTRLANFGTLEIVGDDAVGVRAANDNTGSSGPVVGNTGTLTITGANGIGIDGVDNNGIANNGTLSIIGDAGIGIRANDSNSVSNTSALTVTGANGIGVRLNNGNSLDNLAALGGDPIGTIEVTGPNGIGVLLGADGGSGNTLTNEGSITGGSDTGAAVSSVPAGVALPNVIRNDPTGTLAAGASGVAVRGGAGVDDINNRGTISGNVLLGGGNDLFNHATAGQFTGDLFTEGGDDTVTIRDVVTGNIDLGDGDDLLRPRADSSVSGSIEGGAGTDTVSLEGSRPGVFDMGNTSGFELLEIMSSSSNEPSPWTLRGTGDFAGGAHVDSGAILVLDEPTTLNGDLSLADEAILRAIVDPQGSSGHLEVNGSVTTTGTVLLEVIEQNPILTSASFELLSASGGIGPGSDPFALSAPPDTAFLDFEIIQSPSKIDLVVTRLSTYAPIATTRNQAAVATNLDALVAAGVTGDLATLIGQIDGLSTSDAAAAFESLHPEAYDAHSSTLLSLGSALVDLVAEGRARCDREYEFTLFGHRQSQPNPCGEKARRIWTQGFATFTKRDAVGPNIDFDTTAGALVAGSDLELGGWLLSAFIGAANASLDTRNVGDGDLTTVELGGLVERSFGPMRMQLVALYGHGWHEQRRAIRIAGVPGLTDARGDFQSDRLVSRSELAYDLELAGIEITPLAQLEYSYLREHGFDETRGAGASLSVAERHASQLRTAFGARIAYEEFQYYWLGRWLTWIDGVWRAEASGRWLRVWAGNERGIRARFVDAPSGTPDFRIEGKDVEQAAIFGGRVTFQPLQLSAVIGVGYDFQFGDGTVVHRGSASVRIPF